MLHVVKKVSIHIGREKTSNNCDFPPFEFFFWLQNITPTILPTARSICGNNHFSLHPSIRLHHVCAGCIWSCSSRPAQKVAHKFCPYFAPRQMCAHGYIISEILQHTLNLFSRIDWIVAHRASGAPRVFQSYCNPCSLSRFVPITKHKNEHSGNTYLCTHTHKVERRLFPNHSL